MTVGLPPTGRTIPPLTAELRLAATRREPEDRAPAARPGPPLDGPMSVRAEAGAAARGQVVAVEDAELPAAPPPEVMAEVREAARCAQRLYEQGRELRFERDSRGRICAELRDLRGDVIRRVPLGDVLELARGAEVG